MIVHQAVPQTLCPSLSLQEQDEGKQGKKLASSHVGAPCPPTAEHRQTPSIQSLQVLAAPVAARTTQSQHRQSSLSFHVEKLRLREPSTPHTSTSGPINCSSQEVDKPLLPLNLRGLCDVRRLTESTLPQFLS